MTIKEVRKLLSVSPSELRLLRKKGMLDLEWKCQDYSETDVAFLKKILGLRQLGFTVEEIGAMQKEELSFPEAAKGVISRVENEIAVLESAFPELINNTATRAGRDVFVQKAAMEITRSLLDENSSFDELDEEMLWTKLAESEQNSQEASDDIRAFVTVAQSLLNKAFFDFKGLRKKFGVLGACVFILAVCFISVFVHVVIQKGSLGDALGDLATRMIVIAVALGFVLFILLLVRKAPKAATIFASVLLILGLVFLALCFLLAIYGIIQIAFS
ncbi:MAG: MerR family transcriptional regulator [Clostridia bacterium]|nr:MerR family transcriptional regulator [Clostridia bacterium]